MGNTQVLNFADSGNNIANYWPITNPGSEMFTAGTRLAFHADRNSGTIPAHTVQIQGYYNIMLQYNNSHNNETDNPTQ